MAYVAVHGGEEAILAADRLRTHTRCSGKSASLGIDQIADQLSFLVDRVMGEGGLYAPGLAALAVKQAEGDTLEAAFYLRAYRTTLPDFGSSVPCASGEMRAQRRVSSAFKDVPGGQILGATIDYRQRLLDFGLAAEDSRLMAEKAQEARNGLLASCAAPPKLECLGSVVDILRAQGLAHEAPPVKTSPSGDITRDGFKLPAARDQRLQMMSRGETGGLLALAYSSMRGYGSVHPTIAELRYGEIPLRVPHPFRPGKSVLAGWIRVTEVEIVSGLKEHGPDGPRYGLGYGVSFGSNEIKAISMAVLDRAMRSPDPGAPAEDEEFVLLHTDGIESMGFCAHFKLPHYITFQASLDAMRKARARVAHEAPDAALVMTPAGNEGSAP